MINNNLIVEGILIDIQLHAKLAQNLIINYGDD